MAIDPELAEMMQDSATFYAESSRDAYGKTTFSGTSQTVTGRLAYKTQMMKDVNGRDVVSIGKFSSYGAVSPSITVKHKMVVDGATVPIVAVDSITDETDLEHHIIVYFGA
jgi:hypothetical protein